MNYFFKILIKIERERKSLRALAGAVVSELFPQSGQASK